MYKKISFGFAALVFGLLACTPQKSISSEAGGKKPASTPAKPASMAGKTVYYLFNEGVYVETVLDRNPVPKSDNKRLYTNLNYPADAREHGIKGEVRITVILNEVGQMISAEITKKIGGGCDEEALRAVKEVGALGYEPAIKGGFPAKVKFDIPVRFDLQ